MKIAVVGCAHGELNRVYDDILAAETRDGISIELVIISGDFQAVRNTHDLECMAVPKKFRALGDFHEYYWGQRSAPKLTLIIGGNHEASSYMITLPYGGWLAPNIYYMGYAGVVRFKGLRIGGISGIHKHHDAEHGHYEHCPLDQSSMRSCYHVRDLEIHRLMRLKAFGTANESLEQVLDVMISHDWPINIDKCGNTQQLIRWKPFFRQEVQQNRLGNPLLGPLIGHLKPRYWFAAHLHVRFGAQVLHNTNAPRSEPQVTTEFLALDKILQNRKYLEIIDIDPQPTTTKSEPNVVESTAADFQYDPQWLAILRSTNKYMSADKFPKVRAPKPWVAYEPVSNSDLETVRQLAGENLSIPFNFTRVAPALEPEQDSDPRRMSNFVNPQTELFCETFELKDPIRIILDRTAANTNYQQLPPKSSQPDPDPSHGSDDVDQDGGSDAQFNNPPASQQGDNRREEINSDFGESNKRQKINNFDKQAQDDNNDEEDPEDPIMDESGLFFIDKRGSDPFSKSNNSMMISLNSSAVNDMTNSELDSELNLLTTATTHTNTHVTHATYKSQAPTIRDHLLLLNRSPTTSPILDQHHQLNSSVIAASSELDPVSATALMGMQSEADLRQEFGDNLLLESQMDKEFKDQNEDETVDLVVEDSDTENERDISDELPPNQRTPTPEHQNAHEVLTMKGNQPVVKQVVTNKTSPRTSTSIKSDSESPVVVHKNGGQQTSRSQSSSEEHEHELHNEPTIITLPPASSGGSSSKLKSDLTMSQLRQLRRWNEKYLTNKAHSDLDIELISQDELQKRVIERGIVVGPKS